MFIRDRWRSWRKAGVPLGIAAAVILAATSAPASVASSSGGAGGAAAPKGLISLGSKVLASAPVEGSTGPWLVWNHSTCSYQVAKTHPAAYKADLRPVQGSPKIGYMDYGDTDPFGAANSANIKKVAAQAGFKLDVYNLQYPSQTAPIAQARAAVLKKDIGVIQAQQIPAENKSFLKILQSDGCIPTVQMYLTTPNVPSFGAAWPPVGTAEGAYLGQQAKARHWNPADTALVQCGSKSLGESVNVMFTTGTKALAASGFKLPKSNIYFLDCAEDSPAGGLAQMKDWLVAHPNAKNIMIMTIDDERNSGLVKALKQSNRYTNSLNVAGGCDSLGQSNIKNGGEQACIAFFPEKYGAWLVPIMEDVLAGNPVPSFTASGLVTITKQNIKKYYP
jgi:ribose transport system substrate-binding protein